MSARMAAAPAERRLRIAMIGTRGVPAAYGGFETAVEEIGSRLASWGHGVLVYGRESESEPQLWYRGMRTVAVPALNSKTTETFSRTGLSVAHAVAVARPDVAFVFNAANAPFLQMLRGAGIPVATHVDGLEWRRAKWGRNGKRYYRWAEGAAVRWSDALIADAPGISEYYRKSYGAPTELLAYGAPILENPGAELLPSGYEPLGYHVVVARFEPENHVLEIVRGYSDSDAKLPLVVVGASPFAERYTDLVKEVAARDERIRLVGRVDDQAALDQLYANALTYLHGHSVGGTNPSLLRAMGAGTQVVAFDVNFNREVAGPDARYFAGPDDIPALLAEAERDPRFTKAAGTALQKRAAERYRWDEVAQGYLALAQRLAQGESLQRMEPTWEPASQPLGSESRVAVGANC